MDDQTGNGAAGPDSTSPDGADRGSGDHRVVRTALVVAADHQLRDVARAVLEERGWELELCWNAKAAGEVLKGLAPKLAVLDWRLGGHGCSDLVERLRAGRTTARCQVLAAVADDDPDGAEDAASVGADDVIVLPVDSSLLAIRVALAERRLEATDQLVARLESLSHSARRLSLASRASRDGLWEWDLRRSTLTYSAQWKSLLGLGDSEISSHRDEWIQRVHPDDREALGRALNALVSGGTDQLEHEHRLQHADGEYRTVVARAVVDRAADGKPVRVVGLLSDVSRSRQAELELAHAAHHDRLTGLPNRDALVERLTEAVARARRQRGGRLAVLLLDMDRFRNINDSLGHEAGDTLLRAIADRLRSALGSEICVARIGGDEFVVVAEEVVDVRAAVSLAETIQVAFREPFELAGHDVFTSASIGICLASDTSPQPADLLRDADTAMFCAKELGASRYAVFEPRLHELAERALRLDNELRRAIERHEFCPFFQPIVALGSGAIIGFEVLVRWLHPERGLLSPGEFIDEAESTGAVVDIDRLMLDDACHQLRAWQATYRKRLPLILSVNLSSLHFRQPDVIARIDQTLRSHGLYGRSIKLEITEGALMEDAPRAVAMINQLKALDMSITIDDFGTGYSSLSYLHQYDVDAIKIDQSFVARMLDDDESRELVQTMLNMAANLGKQTIVEGVELKSQLEMLRTMNADCIQGYFVARPLPADRAEGLLDAVVDSPNHLETVLEARSQGQHI